MEIMEQRDAWRAHFRARWQYDYRSTGKVSWKHYRYVENTIKEGTAGLSLRDSKLMFISSAGAFLPASQQPFNAADPEGDYSIRVLPVDLGSDHLGYAHEHYDNGPVKEDIQVLIPLKHLIDLVAQGKVGALSPQWISFMGYQPDADRVLEETLPLVMNDVKREAPDAAFLVPS